MNNFYQYNLTLYESGTHSNRQDLRRWKALFGGPEEGFWKSYQMSLTRKKSKTEMNYNVLNFQKDYFGFFRKLPNENMFSKHIESIYEPL